jgi:hypothetical protein
MGPPTSLFSRARLGISTPKRVRGFLSLPGEVRNQIYQYCFDFEFRCEVAAKGRQFETHQPRTVKLWAGAFQSRVQTLQYSSTTNPEPPITIRISRPLGKYTIVQGLQTKWLASLFAIHLVCKQIHSETLAVIYHKTVFVFDAPKRIANFLDTVPRPKLEYITKLQLHYTTYGCPKWTKDCVWQDKHHDSWIRACSAASKKLSNVRTLKIWMRVMDDPLRFDLRQSWVVPLLQFRRLARVITDNSPTAANTPAQMKKLDSVEVDFQTRLSGCRFAGNHRLAKANEDLHRLFGRAIGKAILGAKANVAMADFNAAWEGEYAMWQYHLGFAKTGW